jgi:RNA polymerase sigma-70 factor (ECF subfamily)
LFKIGGNPFLILALSAWNVEREAELKEIVEGCVRNERKQQERLFKLLYGKMIVVALRYTSDRDSAEEIVQEGFIKVFDKLSMFDFKGSFEGWVRRIVANTAIDMLRKNKKMPFLSDNDQDFKEGVENPMEDLEIVEQKQAQSEMALKAVQLLSPAYRTVFNMYVMEEYTHKEIAEILGISEGTSKSNLAKAKMNLQKLMERNLVK